MMGFGWALLHLALLTLSVVCRAEVETPPAPKPQQQSSFFGDFVKIVESAIDLIFSPFYSRKPPDTVTYKDFQLLRVFPRTEDHVDDLEEMLEDEDGVQFWTPALKNKTTDILLPPDMIPEVKEYLTEQKIEYQTLISNLQKEINIQGKSMKDNILKSRSEPHPFTFQSYHRFVDMMDYLRFLEESYPHLVELITIGKSNQGRPLKVVKISSGNTEGLDKKPAIWIDAGTHGREWITPAVAMFLIKQLVQNYRSTRRLVDNLDWYIMPIMNPDGYEYTHTKDRLWRKNMSPGNKKGASDRRGRFFWDGSRCKGVDLNRNWGFHWGEAGASDNPCRETYAGPQPFSEPETRAVSDFILDKKSRLKVFLTLHAYSQMWLIPWSYTKSKAKDYDDLMFLGKRAINALQKIYGTEFHLGSSPSLLYPIAGSADDWAKGKAGVKYSYTVELRDKGKFGFLLPPSQIVPTGRETFAAVKAMARAIIDKVVD
ncbi:hypothetical protein LSTR_LSTR008349 [Laodelphax striatellus]|uniref:Peptidase M14 domain-containing protein n=1 Tax=Laodelphax striatellus TaxID=195883 RepID=A0A482XSS2_LAOST|nr:hypothetical protein LSTR_LSTR008349 [Laodelphax striatellus]